jgi:hypothetical protein
LLGARMFFGSAYSLPTLIELVAKVACIVHVIREGRSLNWLWLILFFPVGGPLIYFIFEIWPDLRSGRGSRGFNFRLPQNPTKTIARLTEELEYSSTVEKRVQLARAYAAAGRHGEAVETVRSCLSGVFKEDPTLTFELAEICFGAGLYQEALDALATLDRLKFKGSRHQRSVLAARCYEKLGNVAAAKVAYEESFPTAVGEEARCRYAQLLAANGESGTARALFEEIGRNAKHGGGNYRRLNREWIKQASSGLGMLAGK